MITYNILHDCPPDSLTLSIGFLHQWERSPSPSRASFDSNGQLFMPQLLSDPFRKFGGDSSNASIDFSEELASLIAQYLAPRTSHQSSHERSTHSPSQRRAGLVPVLDSPYPLDISTNPFRSHNHRRDLCSSFHSSTADDPHDCQTGTAGPTSYSLRSVARVLWSLPLATST